MDFSNPVASLAAREATVSKITSVPDVEARRDKVQALFRDTVFFPLNLDKTPLNPRVTRTFHDDRGFTVRLMTLESRPKYYVTAALFIPDNATRPMPAVVFPSGHAPQSFRLCMDAGCNQEIIINLVMRGMAVLAYDPPGQGEREHLDRFIPGGRDFPAMTDRSSHAEESPPFERRTSRQQAFNRLEGRKIL